MWCVYLITCGNRTYVGSTTDPKRRLRQHNREIKGGARATAALAPGWSIAAYLEGFESRSAACRWEKLIKSRARGLRQRLAAFSAVADGQCPTGRTHYDPPKGLKFYLASSDTPFYKPPITGD